MVNATQPEGDTAPTKKEAPSEKTETAPTKAETTATESIVINKKSIDSIIGSLKDVMDIKYENLNAEPGGTKASISGVDITFKDNNEKLRIDNAKVNEYKHTKGKQTPEAVHVILEGINVPKNSDIFKEKVMQDLGYSELKANAELKYKYSYESKDFNLEKLSLGIKNLGNLTLNFHLNDIDLEFKNKGPMALLMVLPNIKVNSAKVAYNDDSFATRLFQTASKNMGKSVDEVKKEAKSVLDNEFTTKSDNEFKKSAINALKRFIDNPKKIAITIKPDKPVPISEIEKVEGPDALIKLLNLKIEN